MVEKQTFDPNKVKKQKPTRVTPKRLAAGMVASALAVPSVAAIDDALNSKPHPVVDRDSPRAIKVRMGSGDFNERLSEFNGFGEAIRKGGDLDHDKDGIPNADDDDVRMYSVSEAERATGVENKDLQWGQSAVVGEVREPKD